MKYIYNIYVYKVPITITTKLKPTIGEAANQLYCHLKTTLRYIIDSIRPVISYSVVCYRFLHCNYDKFKFKLRHLVSCVFQKIFTLLIKHMKLY
jgi:hypothetical protein